MSDIEAKEIINSFRRVYSEDEARILKIMDTGASKKIITAKFNDGVFYFAVDQTTVSPSYNTEADAIKYA